MALANRDVRNWTLVLTIKYHSSPLVRVGVLGIKLTGSMSAYA